MDLLTITRVFRTAVTHPTYPGGHRGARLSLSPWKYSPASRRWPHPPATALWKHTIGGRDKSGENRHESQVLNSIISSWIITFLLSQTPDISISSSLRLALSNRPAVKMPSKDFTTSLFQVSVTRNSETHDQSVKGRWQGNPKKSRLLTQTQDKILCVL